jgi:hypothetical protein
LEQPSEKKSNFPFGARNQTGSVLFFQIKSSSSGRVLLHRAASNNQENIEQFSELVLLGGFSD